MPIKNGFDAAKEIRRYEKENGKKEVPIIALTASTFPDEIDKAIESGMNECISKPTTQPIIEEIVSRHLQIDINI